MLARCVILFASVFIVNSVAAQESYRYSVDLTRISNDQLTVELLTPAISRKVIDFYFPKIVPGTYMNSNYGKYVHNLEAFDKKGTKLPVKQINDNGWQISNADKLHKITYQVEDTWDSDIHNKVYPMCGTNFEAGKNFVINPPGLFGHFQDMKKLPYDISFTKPAGFYAATGLKPVSTTDLPAIIIYLFDREFGSSFVECFEIVYVLAIIAVHISAGNDFWKIEVDHFFGDRRCKQLYC